VDREAELAVLVQKDGDRNLPSPPPVFGILASICKDSLRYVRTIPYKDTAAIGDIDTHTGTTRDRPPTPCGAVRIRAFF
jgi:hypothetical protein